MVRCAERRAALPRTSSRGVKVALEEVDPVLAKLHENGILHCGARSKKNWSLVITSK